MSSPEVADGQSGHTHGIGNLLLVTELREFEVLVSQLKDSLNSTSPMFDSLYTEIRNMTAIVNQLETYDKSNLEVIRIEFAKLQKKLEECQKDTEIIKPDIALQVMAGVPSCLRVSATQRDDDEDTIQDTLGRTLKAREK